MSDDTRTLNDDEALEEIARARDAIMTQVRKRIYGQEELIEHLLIALFARGHCLLKGVPGLAKTYLISTLAEVLSLDFNRIQFTPDLMPSDITGTDILEEDHTSGRRYFKFIKGPVFTNLLLADEINRTPPKTQAALLQSMQEYKVSAGGTTYDLTRPFMVFATQNPIEQEGTYPLPEAQVDRFMLMIRVGYPTRDEERRIMDLVTDADPVDLSAVTTPEQILAAQRAVRKIHLADELKDYIVDIICATRDPREFGLPQLERFIEFGASPRATIFLNTASRAHAFIRGRDSVYPEDIKAIAYDVLRHRVALTYEAEAEEQTPESVIETILETIEVP